MTETEPARQPARQPVRQSGREQVDEADDQASHEDPQQAPSSPPAQPKPLDFRNPITAERQVTRLEFLYRRPPVCARTARVFVTSSGRCVEYRPEKQPTTGELLFSGVRTMYDVDLSVHVTQLEAAPPSNGDKIAFSANIDLIWQVIQPSKVVLSGVSDVRQAVAPVLLRRLRSVTRQFQIEDPEKAERAANGEFADGTLGVEFGLSFQVFIRLAMDEHTLRHEAINRQVDLFRQIIEAGDFNQFALQLAIKPEDINTVVQMLVEERDSHRKAVFDFVTRLLESDALDRWQIDDQVRTTLQWLRDSGYKVLAGTDQARKFSYGDNHRGGHGDNGPSIP